MGHSNQQLPSTSGCLPDMVRNRPAASRKGPKLSSTDSAQCHEMGTAEVFVGKTSAFSSDSPGGSTPPPLNLSVFFPILTVKMMEIVGLCQEGGGGFALSPLMYSCGDSKACKDSSQHQEGLLAAQCLWGKLTPCSSGREARRPLINP